MLKDRSMDRKEAGTIGATLTYSCAQDCWDFFAYQVPFLPYSICLKALTRAGPSVWNSTPKWLVHCPLAFAHVTPLGEDFL